MGKVSNEKKNLNRLAGEFLVASRLTHRGFMVTLQWGNTISYDILAFDKNGNVAFIEVKTTASHPRKWLLQSKYAFPERDAIPLNKRFVCCVDISSTTIEPIVHVFSASAVAKGLHYYFHSRFPKSPSYPLYLDCRPKGQSNNDVKTVAGHIEADNCIENFNVLGLNPVKG